MSYLHGVYTSQLPTSITPARETSAAAVVAIGCAPVHMVKDGYTGPVNEPQLFNSYSDAVATLGDSDDWEAYNLAEVVYSQFALFGIAPLIAINVFDPAVHKTAVVGEAKTLVDDKLTLAHPGLVAAPVVKDEAGETTYVKDTDYSVDLITGVVTRISSGSILAGATLKIDYEYGDPSLVDADDIIGGIDAGTGAKTGIELIDEVFPRFGLVPGIGIAPGYSQDPSVAAVLSTKMGNINGIFKGMAYVDIPSGAGGVLKYQDAPAWKTNNNYTDNNMAVFWPKVKLEGKKFWLSTQAAGLSGRVDVGNDDVPYESPSNKNLEMNGLILEDGTEVIMGQSEANYLNGQGVVTCLNIGQGGWRLWGNRTGCYPANTDPKDAFIAIQRMFQWEGNNFILTYWQKTDQPLNRRLIESIVDSENYRLNGLASRGFILGGRLVFLRGENPVTDLMDGKINIHIYMTPPAPAREINGLIEFDPGYLSTLFGE